MTERTDGETVEIGVIGLGVAARAMVPVLSRHGGFVLAATAEIDDEIRARFENDFGARGYEHGEELIERDDVRAVYIATPSPLHVPLARRALEAGKHVLVEKPMALGLDEADMLVEEAERRGLYLMEDEQNSFDPPIRKATEIIASGALGKTAMIHAWHYGGWLYSLRMPEELRPEPEFGGGVLMRQGPHQLNIVRTLGGGPVRSVRGSVGIWDPNRPVVGMYSAWIEFENGVVANAVYSGYDRFQSSDLNLGIGAEDSRPYARARMSLRSAVSGESEAARKRDQRYGGPATRGGSDGATPSTFGWLASGVIMASCEGGDIRITPTGLVVYGEEERERIDLPLGETGRDEVVRQFYSAIVDGRTPEHGAGWSRDTLAVCLAVQRSAASGAEVILD